MKKEMILPSSSVRSGQYAASRPSVFAAFKGYCLHLLHAKMAFVLMVFPFPFSPFVRFLFLGWFALTMVQCRRAGLK